MSKFFLVSLFLILAGSRGQAATGDVIEIDHGNLVSFGSQQSGNCYLTSPDPQTPSFQALNYTVWSIINYRDAAGKTNRVVYPITQTQNSYYPNTEAQDCQTLLTSAQSYASTWNAELNDIQKNNLAPQGNTCEAKYLVVTLTSSLTLPDGSVADTGNFVPSTKAAPCP